MKTPAKSRRAFGVGNAMVDGETRERETFIYYKAAGLVRLRRKTMRKMTLSKSILRRAFVL